jgi:hypothetical protein
MFTLKETINSFVSDKKHEAGMTLEQLNEWFKTIAQVILSGHFEVQSNNDKECVKVYPTTVEMYFHEEREGKYIKDFIVYHRNGKIKDDNKLRRVEDGKDIKYYPLGVLNTHPSGIDITFESEKRRFRASALIRAFNVENGKTSKVTGVQYVNQKEVDIDGRSTYIYDALFSQFSILDGFSVRWVDCESEKKLKTISNPVKRKNVYEYDDDGNKLSELDTTRLWSFSVKEDQNLQQ